MKIKPRYGVILLILLMVFFSYPVFAGNPDNDSCFGCHEDPEMNTTLESGENLVLTIRSDLFNVGVHGENNLACVSCHSDNSDFPHPPKTAVSRRDYSLRFYTICKQCHRREFEKTLDSVHQKALAGGNKNAAVCTDCHNPHTQTRVTDKNTKEIIPEMRRKIPQTCAQCHSIIYNSYKDSVHGTSLGEGNPDVPTCINCHGVHNVPDPTSAKFRLKSPTAMCGKCHTNPAIMKKYNISTNVLESYISDFHGTTVVLFEKTAPDQQTNKPVCFDCHGVHDIRRVNDPLKGLQVKENLLNKCKKCHPDANANFPNSWLGHYIPSPTKYPVVYFVGLFYKILIPTVITFMIIFVISDFIRNKIIRRKKEKSE